MELSEQVTALTAENKALKDNIENTAAEKIALDQLLVESLKSGLSAKKDLVLSQVNVQRLQQELAVAKLEKEAIEKQYADFKKASV